MTSGAIMGIITIFVTILTAIYFEIIRPLLDFAKPCKKDIDTLLENKDPTAEIFYFDNGFFDPIEVPKAEYYAIMLNTYIPEDRNYIII